MDVHIRFVCVCVCVCAHVMVVFTTDALFANQVCVSVRVCVFRLLMMSLP